MNINDILSNISQSLEVYAYARYSTDMQSNNSTAFQFREIEKYCGENNLKIVGYYSDEAVSGTTVNREDFQRLCSDVRSNHVYGVVIYDITRGSRDVADWFQFRKDMSLLHTKVISTQDKLGDILNPNDFLVELIGVGIGQHHVLTTRQKTIEGTTQRAMSGAFLGGYAPYGYDIVNQKYVINPVEAQNVKKMFEMYSDGYS